MLEHRAPLDQLSRAHNTKAIDRPALRCIAIEDRGYLLLQGEPPDALLHEGPQEQVGIQVPGPQEARVRGEYALLWMTPREWLLELPVAETSAVATALLTRLASALAVVTDMSDSFACFDIGGDRVTDVLTSGCSLDLRPSAFAVDRVARTAFANVPAILWKRGSLRFRCLVDRSFAEHFWNWLAESPARW